MYEFKSDDAFDFARHVGIVAKHIGTELRFKYCPYCRGGNNGKDKDTFSINLSTGQFNCQRSSCGVTGNMITLSQDFDFTLNRFVDEYYRKKKTYKQLPQINEIKPKNEAVEYLKSRGINEDVAVKYGITVCKDNPNVLVFPFYDENGVLQFVKYRKTDFDKTKDKNKEWCEANCKPVLFGMKQCEGYERLIINEGQIDSLSVSACGIKNAVSVPTGANGFTWLPYCWDWINKFSEIVVFGDYEKGHITLLDELKKRLKTRVKHVRECDYKDCKDANEILMKYGKEQVIACVENAVNVPINHVKDLSEVEDVDIFKIPKIQTGIRQIDKLLYGGLPVGGLVILTGKCGNGKSTLGSQIIVSALEQGYNCFAYSGEMPNHQFKAWLDFQIAGSRHIFEYQNQYGDKNFAISKNNKTMISSWYKERCFIYDNQVITGEDEKEELIKIVENVIMQYGVKLIFIDNLMTAMELEELSSSDKYDRQSKFCHKLAKLALNTNVIIILVAHKRKNSYQDAGNDDVSGSSDITNLGTVVISYERGSENEMDQSQRCCKITKNRLFGKIETRGFILNYDEKSKRIYGYGDDVNKEYGWVKEFEKSDINDNNPFL